MAALPWLAIAGCSYPMSHNDGLPPDTGLYQYDGADVLKYLKRYGYLRDGAYEWWQDETGDTVYVTELRPGATFDWVISASSDLPVQIRSPWLEPIQRWRDPTGKLWTLPAHVQNALIDSYLYLDRQSGYFLHRHDGSDKVSVGHMQQQEKWIFETNTGPDFVAHQICARGDTIYLLDHRSRDRPSFLHRGSNCWTFRPDTEGIYHRREVFSLPAVVIAVDPAKPRFLCRGYGYMPFPGTRFLFNVATKNRIRNVSSDKIVVFADRDWLRPLLKQSAIK